MNLDTNTDLTQENGLIGSRCGNCGAHYFPPRDLCPRCLSTGRIVPYILPVRGVIATWTVVRLSKKFTPPYAIAWVDFHDGVRVLGRIENWRPDMQRLSGATVISNVVTSVDEVGVSHTADFHFSILEESQEETSEH